MKKNIDTSLNSNLRSSMFFRFFCRIGGADFDLFDRISNETKKHLNELNVFFIIGIFVCMLSVFSFVTMYLLIENIILIKVFVYLFSICYSSVILNTYRAILSVGNKSSKNSLFVNIYFALAVIFISVIVTAGIIKKYFVLSYDDIKENIYFYLFLCLSILIFYTLPIMLKEIIFNRFKYMPSDIFKFKIDAENEAYRKLYPEHMGHIIKDAISIGHIEIIKELFSNYVDFMHISREKYYNATKETDKMADVMSESEIKDYKKDLKDKIFQTAKNL